MFQKMTRLGIGFAAMASLAAVSPAAEIVLNPSADAFVNSVSPTTNYGSDTAITITGTSSATPPEHINAALFRFDTSAIPSGATIDSVEFRFYVTAASGNGFFEFFQLIQDWNEAEVTWNEASTGNAWGTVGGSWGGSQLGNNDVLNTEAGGFQTYTSNAALVAEVQDWLDNPSTNYGIHLRRRFGNTGQFVTLPSSEAGSNQPELVVNYTYTPVPEPGTLALAGLGGLMLLRRRR